MSWVRPRGLDRVPRCPFQGFGAKAAAFEFVSAVVILIAALWAPAAANDSPLLQYQSRGDRYEGLRPKPVSGYDVALLSARVDYRTTGEAWPDRLRLRFFLPVGAGPHIIVRQLRSKSRYYWLDRVKPLSPWRPGEFNEFSWPTATVLRKLETLRIGDLGTVIRLGEGDPVRKSERVAPVLLYHSRIPELVEGYRFTFKTNGEANVNFKVYRGESVVFERPETKEKAGSPFTVRWPSAGEPAGEYRMVLSGRFSDGSPVDKEISFLHLPRLSGHGSTGTCP